MSARQCRFCRRKVYDLTHWHKKPYCSTACVAISTIIKQHKTIRNQPYVIH